VLTIVTSNGRKTASVSVPRFAELTADRLRLRIQLRSEIKEESYRPAKVPSVCPDMPRREGPVPGH
jgi:hypothetical protein